MEPLRREDFAAMRHQLRDSVDEDRKHWVVNDVKIDAIHTARTYEEFADRVAAAHLRPLERADFKNKATTGWNKYVIKEKSYDE